MTTTSDKRNIPEVTLHGVLDLQVCVPADYTDEQILEFAETERPCGTTTGWKIRKQGSRFLCGQAERVACAQREGFVHVMLDA